MFGTGLLKGLGITLKHMMDTFSDDRKEVPSRYQDSLVFDNGRRIMQQPIEQEGLLTIQYPEEKRLLPERFRYIPMLIWDTEKGEDLCTACGICAKVCPPQCIWIVRDMDAKGRRVSVPRFGPRDPAQVLRHERHPAAKLTAAQVRDIRSSMANGTDLAQRYGIDKTTVSRVRRGQTWRGL